MSNASELLAPPPGRPGVAQYIYANGQWRAVGGVDRGDGTAGMLVSVTGGLVPKDYDSIALTYNGDGTVATVVYSAAGAVVATLTLSYTSGQLTQVVRT